MSSIDLSKIEKYRKILALLLEAYQTAEPVAVSLYRTVLAAYLRVKASIAEDPEVTDAEFASAVGEFRRAVSVVDPLGRVSGIGVMSPQFPAPGYYTPLTEPPDPKLYQPGDQIFGSTTNPEWYVTPRNGTAPPPSGWIHVGTIPTYQFDGDDTNDGDDDDTPSEPPPVTGAPV